ncbi:uncharacterized protein LOC118742485 isoform X1 [Rhagoletis pomonella]|uniref:uncharacterized protein LOC118742485 isoform X1 n=1 Tax=Rhagoletis pomonella TaxID=28610 RepID=UPI00177C3A58|nr:uncharacterized protein LOC118742485 isoform X1 [Rhagoletis pomonella]
MQSVIRVSVFILAVCWIVQEQGTQALIHDIIDIIDLQSLNLANYEYFRNLPSQNPKTAAKANLFREHFQKKKAVLDYIEHLFLGTSPFSQESEIPFNPHLGRAWRPYFERKYGKHGANLVDMLGRGYSLQQLRQQGAIPKDFGTPYYPTR